MKKLFVSAAFALVLTACQSSQPTNPSMGSHSGAHKMPAPNYNAPLVKYECRGGLMPTVKQLSTEQVELTLDDKKVVLNISTSGSGALYASKQGLFGTGAEWHTKGDMAFFSFKDPYGNLVEDNCKVFHEK